MKIYRYWSIEKSKVNFGQEEKEISCYGGSNISEQDALEKAKEKIEKVKRKIHGDASVFDSYEVEIREEIIREIDAKTIITRNRYGAQVLNVQDLMILDIDKPESSFLDIFKKPKDDKTKILELIHKLSNKAIYQGYGLRIYETFKGIRVIVLGGAFDAKAAATQKMMQEFHCDDLYSLLCSKQGCFRARLTPKPGRMKLKGRRVQFPRSSEEDEGLRVWLSAYEAASQNYGVCKFIEQIGTGNITEAVRVHDEMTGAYLHQTLA